MIEHAIYQSKWQIAQYERELKPTVGIYTPKANLRSSVERKLRSERLTLGKLENDLKKLS